MTNTTTTRFKAGETENRWLLYDASEHVLGRMAVQIAMALMGKDRPSYTANELVGAHVVVINSRSAKLTGRKSADKNYVHYTYHHGGQRVIPISRVLERRPNDVVKLAVRRMLPKNRLGDKMLKRLKIYSGVEHPHTAQKPVRVEAR